MNRIELIRMLRGHIKLAEKRSAAYEQNRTAKVVMYVMSIPLYGTADPCPADKAIHSAAYSQTRLCGEFHSDSYDKSKQFLVDVHVYTICNHVGGV